MPVANSMFSRPRVASPRASEKTLPCSRLMRAATSSRRRSKISRKRKRTRARRRGGWADQSGKAAVAAATAASTSAAVASGTRDWMRPVGGVVDVGETVRGAGGGEAVDPVVELGDGGGGGGGGRCGCGHESLLLEEGFILTNSWREFRLRNVRVPGTPLNVEDWIGQS